MNTALGKSLIFVASFLILGAGCSLPWGKNNQSADGNNNNKPGTVDTSDWMEYTNEEYGFSFQYPEEGKVVVPDWQYSQIAPNLSYALGTSTVFGFNIFSKIDPDISFEAAVTNLSLEEIIKNIESEGERLVPGSGLTDVTVLSNQKFENKRIAKAVHGTAFGPEAYFYFVSFENYKYSFFFTYLGLIDDKVLKIITSSIKILD